MWWMVPTVVWVFVAAHGQPARTLSEAAWRAALQRHLSAPAVRALTDQDVPRAQVEPPPPPAGADAGASAAAGATAATGAPRPAASVPHDEKWWRERMTSAKAALEKDQVLLTGLMSRLNSLATDIVNRDDPAQRGQLIAEQKRTQQEWEAMQKQVATDRERISSIEEEARVQGIPPGWIR